VLVIPYRNPVVTAKALATADYLSDGRVHRGAGVGWWREEFDALGVRFEDRADRTVEYLRLMKEIWTGSRVSFEGRFARIAEAGGVRPAGRDRIPLSGSAAQIAEDLSAYVAAGVEHFVLDFSVATVPEMLEVLERTMTDVKPRIRS
jgi:alkanesulfonate monooxygenase SsuD/methylene tetrahydromethanopterin reductase-like flavin-dependent oxidoreductase (luciferase family)